jgi:DNA polymerase-3 subunit delta'
VSTHPAETTELFGHENAMQALLAEYAAGRLPHGLLLCGPRGIGKASFAYALARRLLARPGEDETVTARRIIARSHADLLVVEPAFDAKKDELKNEIGVEQAREVSQFLSLTPGEASWRMVIVDSIDQLNSNAANAILKILEEPPPQALLVLVSHNSGRLLPTIRSRCRQVRLAPLSREAFASALRQAAPELSPYAMEHLRQLADGSPGLALELHASDATTRYGELLALAASVAQGNPAGIHAFSEQLAAPNAHKQAELMARLQLALLERLGKTAAGLLLDEVVEGEEQALAALCRLHSPQGWARKWQLTAEQFSLAQARHLDYKQLLIAWFHALPDQPPMTTDHAA